MARHDYLPISHSVAHGLLLIDLETQFGTKFICEIRRDHNFELRAGYGNT